MKILLISTAALDTPPKFYGGQEQVVADLAEILIKKGHKVSIACTSGSIVPKGVEHIPTVNKDIDGFFENLALIEYWERLDEFDIIHDNSHAKQAYSIFYQKPEIFRFLSTLHCPTSIIYPLTRPNLVCISRSHSNNIWELYGYESKIVYNGINLGKYEYQEEKGDRFVFLGRPNPQKGLLEAIEYCKKLDVGLDVIGGMLESMSEYAISVARACPIDSKWRYWGAVTHQTKVNILKNAKALISPLNWNVEPFGLIVPEALACGTPIITYNKGSMPELVKNRETGYVVNSPAGFKRAMLSVNEIDPKVCRKDAEERWSRERMTVDYLRVYTRVLEGERW